MQCRVTKNWLKRKRVPFTFVDVDDEPGLADDLVKRYGITSLPVCVAGDDVWGGFSESRLTSLLELEQMSA